MDSYEYDSTHQLDELDRGILRALAANSRRAFTDIAKKLEVSSGTIHQRYNKLIEMGVITGSKITIDFKQVGYDVTTLLGIHLKNGNDHEAVVDKLKKIKNIVEINYTTGTYGLIIKVKTHTIDDLHSVLVNKIQKINEVQSTESFISLKQYFSSEAGLI